MDFSQIAALLPFIQQLLGKGAGALGIGAGGGAPMGANTADPGIASGMQGFPQTPMTEQNLSPAGTPMGQPQNVGIGPQGLGPMPPTARGAPMPGGLKLQDYANVMKALHGLNADKGGAAWAPAFHWNPSAPANNAMRPSPARPAIGAMFASPAGQEALANLRQMMLGQDAGAGGGY